MTSICDQNVHRHAKLEPWIEFIQQIADSEVGDYWTDLERAYGSASSAQEFDHASRILDMFDELVDDVREEAHGGWVEEAVERAQDRYDEMMDLYAEGHKPQGRSPREELEELLSEDQPERSIVITDEVVESLVQGLFIEQSVIASNLTADAGDRVMTNLRAEVREQLIKASEL